MWMRRGERPCDGTLYTTKAVDPHTTGAKGFRFCPVKSAPGCRSSWFVLTVLVRPCGNPSKGVSFQSSADSGAGAEEWREAPLFRLEVGSRHDRRPCGDGMAG